MSKSLVLLVLLSLIGGVAKAAFSYRVNHVQCENAAGRFERLKVFPAVKDETLLTFQPTAERTGVIDYAAEHFGLSGGDCRVSFRLDYEFAGVNLTLHPRRQTLRRAGGYFAPCEKLTADEPREFQLRHLANGFEIEGEDLTRLCGSSKRARVKIVLDRI